MRVLKDNKYNAILNASREEFIRKGYKEASMRDIAQNAGVGLSNIYNYFRNKDEIFLAITKPAKEDLFTFITDQHTEEGFDFKQLSAFGHQEGAVDQYISIISRYKDEFHLLLYHAQGSSIGNFRDMLTDHITQVSHDYMRLEKKYYPDARQVSDFFIHAMASWMVSVLGEMVTHRISRKKIRDFFQEYFRFSFAGWRELTGL